MVKKLTRGMATVAGVLVFLAAAGCYQDPQDRLDQMQQITDMSDVVNDVAMQMAELTFAVDSLLIVVARQDSTIAVLANLAGVPYRR